MCFNDTFCFSVGNFLIWRLYLKRGKDDNPTIGIILCTDKDETIVKYSVLNESKQIFASKYRTILPTEKELEQELIRNQRILKEKI